jgi:hypothetical protein
MFAGAAPDDVGPAALALLVAESAPDHEEVMTRLVMNMLAADRRVLALARAPSAPEIR